MIRPFADCDAPELARVQRRSITHLGPQSYSPEQVTAWLSRANCAQMFRDRRLAGAEIRVAQGPAPQLSVAGYALIEPDGHLDHLYVDPDHAGSGFARLLIEDAQRLGQSFGLAAMYSEVSKIARPVFEKCGWHVEHRRDLVLGGVAIHNYAMQRKFG